MWTILQYINTVCWDGYHWKRSKDVPPPKWIRCFDTNAYSTGASREIHVPEGNMKNLLANREGFIIQFKLICMWRLLFIDRYIKNNMNYKYII